MGRKLSQTPMLPGVVDSVSLPPVETASEGSDFVVQALEAGVIHGDSLDLLSKLPRVMVNLFFTSPPYADARPYSRIHPDSYVEWFLPLARAMFFIRVATPPGGFVIDPFAGSGTTVVVARRLGRRACGFEIHEPFVQEARRRIAEDVPADTPGSLFNFG